MRGREGSCRATGGDIYMYIANSPEYFQGFVKGCSHGAIATEIYLPQLMGCIGFSVVIAITP